MAKKDKGEKNPIGLFPGAELDLNNQSSDMQREAIEKQLKDIYGNNLEINDELVNKVLDLKNNSKEKFIYLPNNLKIAKNGTKLAFKVTKSIGIGWLIFSTSLLVLALLTSTYFGFRYIQSLNLNKDIDGDGIADINIDIDRDLIPEINIDNTRDNKPNLNIDYKGNRRAVFNLDTNEDGKPDKNLVNDASTAELRKTCKINCDINGDGWPDTNLDLDGDGKADIDIDYNYDGTADINLDINGDGVCDIMCDTDGDTECNYNCIKTQYNGLGTGSSAFNGDPKTIAESTKLIIRYTEGETVDIYNLIPTDQPQVKPEDIPIPYKTFSIENLSIYAVEYNIVWKNVKNTFETNNFQYRVISTNNGLNRELTVTPHEDGFVAEKIVIPPKTTQEYRFEFVLVGTGENQNEDQEKHFSALIDVET